MISPQMVTERPLWRNDNFRWWNCNFRW